MRVIGGRLRGKPLKAPDGVLVRPTTGRIRETIFNILSSKNLIDGARVLDLFCGSGALGIEALSRGASEAVFIDKNPESVRLTRQNLAACGFLCGVSGGFKGKDGGADGAASGADKTKDGAVCRIYNTDFQVALKKLEGEQFGLIFLDPPYFDKLEEKCLFLVKKHRILADGGMIIFEHDSKNDLSSKAQGFIIDTRRFGGVSVSFLSDYSQLAHI